MSVILIVLLLLVLLGSPLFVVIGGVTLACFAAYPTVAGGDYLASFDHFTRNFNLLEKMVALADEPTIVAIPFFMVAGSVMSKGAIARRLVEIANALFGWLPGGLAVSAVAACMFFAAISGSSPVTVITIGAIMLPALKAAGYRDRFSLGLITSAGSLGIIIPPSIPMIIYAIFASSAGALVNIENLFIAGVGPGLLIGFSLAIWCVFNGRGVEREEFDSKKLRDALRDGFWSLTLPVFILGGIYLGVFSATQAAAISVILALGIEMLIHRELTLDDLPELLHETAVLMGSILIIITLAFGFSEFLTLQNLPEKLKDLFESWNLGPIAFALALNVMLLLVGCLMDIISAIILFVPLIAPLALELGFDPLHLGLIFIVNLEIGYLTPPLGMNLFVAAGFFGRPFGEVVRSVLPFVAMMLGALLVITYVPRISLQLVALKGEKNLSMDFPTGERRDPEGEDRPKSLEEIMQDLDDEDGDYFDYGDESSGTESDDDYGLEPGGEGKATPSEGTDSDDEGGDYDYDYGLDDEAEQGSETQEPPPPEPKNPPPEDDYDYDYGL